MRWLRTPALRGALTILLALGLLLALGEEAIADVHDGGATHAEVDRVTGTSHFDDAPHAHDDYVPGGGGISGANGDHAPTPERSDHSAHVCHCTHSHIGVASVMDGDVLVGFEHRSPQFSAADERPTAVTLDPWTPPPIA